MEGDQASVLGERMAPKRIDIVEIGTRHVLGVDETQNAFLYSTEIQAMDQEAGTV